MSAFFGQQNLFSIKLQLVVTFREIVTVYDVTAGIRDRHRLCGLVLVHAAPRCLDTARSLTPFSAKRPMQRNNFFSRGHCASLSRFVLFWDERRQKRSIFRPWINGANARKTLAKRSSLPTF